MNFLRKCTSKLVNTKKCLDILHKKPYSAGNLFEPDYLKGMESEIPLYDTLNIQLRGYDFSILESYQKLLHNLIKNIDIDVEECWSNMAQHLQVITYKPKSEVVNSQYNLKIYERVIQVTDVTSLQVPILLRVLESSTPAGVTVHIVPHEEWHEESRYVPDSELLKLKQELEDLGGPSRKK